MFGRHQQQLPSARSKNSNWPSTLPDMKPSTAPACAPVILLPTASTIGLDGLFAASFSTSGFISVAMPDALTSTQPGRSTTRVIAVTGGSVSRVSSATCPAATSALPRSSATA